MPLRNADDDPSKNIGQKHADSLYDLKKREEAGSPPSNSEQAPDDSKNTNLNQAEGNPPDNWRTKVSGNKKTSATGGRFGFVKKKGPLIAIVITLVGGGIGIAGLLSPALMMQSILANLVQKFNIQETSLTLRTNKLIASKLSSKVTDGYCGEKTTILCKFSRPSNSFLTKLGKNGIQALDEKGNVIEKKLLSFNTRPAKYSFTGNDGKTLTVGAEELSTTLAENSEFRAALHNSSNSRFMSLTDDIFKAIESKFQFSLTNKLKNATDSNNLNSEINDNVIVDESQVVTAAKDGAAAEEEVIKDLIKQEGDESIKKLAKAGKGDLVGLAAGAACLVSDVPGLIIKVNRAFQMQQLVKYGMVFLSAFGSIKAGDATAAEVSAIGDALTKVDKNGKSAMDSFGMKYVMTGSTKPQNNNYKNFIPGGGAISAWSGITSITDSVTKKDVCAVMTDPLTGQAINIALTEGALVSLGASLGLAALNLVGGWAASAIISTTLPPILDAAINVFDLESIFGNILSFFSGDLTKNLSGESVGDALTSGASHVMGQTANAGGNMPLSTQQAIAYADTTKTVQLAYAEEDRATLNPFDTSSPNTMLGSIVQTLIPYFSHSNSTVNSITSTFTSIGSMVVGSFSAALKPLTVGAESNNTSQYQLCDDPAIKDYSIAAGPYCNIIYGVPTEYLDEDPITVAANLIKSGDINIETGDPISDKEGGLQSWMDLCTSGTTTAVNSCEITSQKTAEYALYTIDHRIQKSMDPELN